MALTGDVQLQFTQILALVSDVSTVFPTSTLSMKGMN